MRFTTKTEYGLICLAYMAKDPQRAITVKELVQGERYSVSYIEKIMQKLRRAKIVTSHQGMHGGYALAKSPSEITLREIIEALEGHTFDVFCEPRIRSSIVCNHFPKCGVMPIWRRAKDLLDDFFGSITLEIMAKQEFASVRGKLPQLKELNGALDER